MAVPIVVCACGMRLNAPGARPGRVGRCPGCGAALRIPDAPPAETAPGPGVKSKSKGRRRLARGESLLASHAYPFRDVNGVAYSTILPVAWFLVALGPFLLAASAVGGEMPSELFRIALAPSMLGIPPALAYTLTYLNRAFATTFQGEDSPPRWPELDVWQMIRAVVVWLAAIASGAAAGGLPAWYFWSHTGEPGNLDRAAVVLLVVLGAVYAQGALAAGLLFDDVLAMNPVTVLKAMRAMGLGSLRTLAYASCALAAVVGLLALVLRSTSPLVSLPAWLAFWAFAVHEALVATRIWGVECRRRARGLGWFRGASPRS